MADLIAANGPNAGMQYDLVQDSTTLGRHPDCDVVVEAGAVSRHHAQILCLDDSYYLEDLDSRNGTYVNEQQVTDRRSLEDGDRVRICDMEFRFREPKSGSEDVSASVIDDLGPSAEHELGDRVCVVQGSGGPLEQACEHVRHSLTTHRLVFHPFSEQSALQQSLLDENTTALQVLGEGFHRLITLDVAQGLDSHGHFDLAAFYEYGFRRFEDAFDLPPADDFHEQDLMQILMDEETSLVCLLNAHSAPSQERRRMRSLTQEKHHALIVYRQAARPVPTPSSDSVAVESAESDQSATIMATLDAPQILKADNDVRDRPELRAMPAVTRLPGTSLADEQIYFTILDNAIRVFPQARCGCIVLLDGEKLNLQATQQVNLQTGDPTPMTRGIVSQILSQNQAILTANASVQDDFDDMGSVKDLLIHFVMYAPLLGASNLPVGIIQIETAKRFSEDDLKLLVYVANSHQF